MALATGEIDLIDKHAALLAESRWEDDRLLAYFQGRQRIEQLGMAIPQAMRKFLVIANWPRALVEVIASRQQVRELSWAGQDAADPLLAQILDCSNFVAHFEMFNLDRLIYGRAFLSVGANPHGGLPLIRAESPRELSASIDPVTEQITDAARIYGTGNDGHPAGAVLYLPTHTIWARKNRGRWVETRRDVHNFGAVPIVMHLNRRTSGSWQGVSEMNDIIPLADACVRSLTNMQFAQEAHGAPHRWIVGLAADERTDQHGKPVTLLEAYFDAITILSDADAKIGQLPAASLDNFETAMQTYGKQASVVTGLPGAYWGITTANPATEGAVASSEWRMNRNIERQNDQLAVSLGWMAALAYRFATGQHVEGSQIKAMFHDPATPTISQREDALGKRRAAGVLSREGYWDELGWTQARKDKERHYLALEAAEGIDEYLALGAGHGDSPAPSP